MQFHAAEQYLLSLGNEVTAMKLGLDNIRALLHGLGDPQNNYTKVQIAGTNGKGSVCAFLRSICLEARIKAGVYTSPHLVSVTERINIAGRDIGEPEFAAIAARVRDVAEQMLADGRLDYRPTFFEQVTALALVAFAEANVNLAVLETGLGGRYDATTAADADVIAITRIDLDHQEYLGNSIEEIAAEKAAIINDEFDDVVIGAQPEAARRVILERCRQVGARPFDDEYMKWTVTEADDGMVNVETTRHIFPDVTLGLKGGHQIENAETAINIIAALRYGGYGYHIDDSDVIAGLEAACHPGRLEYVGKYLLDGAHNIGGAKALSEYLDENPKPDVIIFGAMKGKDAPAIADLIFPTAQRIILTQVDNSRSLTADEIADMCNSSEPAGGFYRTASVPEAMAVAENLGADNGIILVTGSLYLVGEVKKVLLERSAI